MGREWRLVHNHTAYIIASGVAVSLTLSTGRAAPFVEAKSLSTDSFISNAEGATTCAITDLARVDQTEVSAWISEK